MRPYFAVGEEVILCSKSFPELNGNEYFVEKILLRDESFVCRATGTIIRNIGPEEYGYLLSPEVLSDSGREVNFKESALRKKHKPADQSYSEIIQSTKQLVKS